MKHLREYDEQELMDLMGDLESIGHGSFKPQLGKDYGWTSNLLPVTDEKKDSGLYFSPETIEYMSKSGMIKNFVGIDPNLYFIDRDKWTSSYGSQGPGSYRMDHTLVRVSSASAGILYVLVGNSGTYGFGNNLVRPIGKRAKLHCQKQFLEKFKKFTDKEGHL